MSLSISEPGVVPEEDSCVEVVLVKLGMRRGKTGGGNLGVGPGLVDGTPPAPLSVDFVAALPPENASAAAATRPAACPTSGLEACRILGSITEAGVNVSPSSY